MHPHFCFNFLSSPSPSSSPDSDSESEEDVTCSQGSFSVTSFTSIIARKERYERRKRLNCAITCFVVGRTKSPSGHWLFALGPLVVGTFFLFGNELFGQLVALNRPVFRLRTFKHEQTPRNSLLQQGFQVRRGDELVPRADSLNNPGNSLVDGLTIFQFFFSI